MSSPVSPLEADRLGYRPSLPDVLRRGIGGLAIREGDPTGAIRDESEVRARFPRTFGRPSLRFDAGEGPGEARALKVGVVLSGGQAPGGHNVIAGLFDALIERHGESRLFGFLGGPLGILTGRYEELTAERIAPYRNTGGFDMIGSGRDKIENDEQFAASARTCRELGLDGLVIVGGDDSNTNAALLAEAFIEQELSTTVNGVPKTIDGDLQAPSIEISFGFDTATRTYAQLIGNIARDAASAGKYWHFVKLMGRSASHVTLECALQTRPNLALIAEEVEARGLTLQQIVDELASAVQRRQAAGLRHGVCLVPEGLIEFIPEMRVLIDELNVLLARESGAGQAGDAGDAATGRRLETVGERLTPASRGAFEALPPAIAEQLLADRDAHGNVQVSNIDTHRLLIEGTARSLEGLSGDGGGPIPFKTQAHFLGYEGRSAAPTDFDADYTYGLGQLAAALTAFGRSGYICAISDLKSGRGGGKVLGVPLTSLMQIETRKARPTPVIGKALVDLEGPAFAGFAAMRESWLAEDHYRYPGPIQFHGPPEIVWQPPMILGQGRGEQ